MESKHTKQEWLIENNTVYALHEVRQEKGTPRNVNRFYLTVYGDIFNVNSDELKEEIMANVKLIAEAGNVANETGKTPRQLAEENKHLKKLLEEAYNLMKSK